MNKIVGIVGSGMVGRDPFDPQCWSGSSRNLFLALQKINALEDAFGVEASNVHRCLLAAKNFSRNKRTWRSKLNLDPKYYQALTNSIGKKITQYSTDNRFLQIGAIYDVPQLLNGQSRCYSYHDGNVVEMMQSPMFPERLLLFAEKAKKWEEQVYKKLDKIFTMSEYLRQSFIENFNLPENKVVNVGVGANFEIPSVVPQKNYSNREILFIGADFVRKGGDILIKAFDAVHQNYPNSRLHIVGPREVPGILKQQSWPGVEFHGFLSRSIEDQRETFFSLMEKCTLFVLPSLYEPFGIAVLEAMVYGIPCIATNRWAFREMITPNVNGNLVEPSNIDNLISAITTYLNDPDLCEVHGNVARELTIQKYSWDKVARKISSECVVAMK